MTITLDMMKGDIEMTLDIEDNRSVISIHKEYPIEKFNWTLEFIFKQDRYSDYDFNEVNSKIGMLLDNEDRKKLKTLFSNNTYNSALSVSDKTNKRSYIIMTQVTTIGEFVNSLTHELLHLSRHIDECNNNEELFTSLGNIAGNIISNLYAL